MDFTGERSNCLDTQDSARAYKIALLLLPVP
jgi:hypothetical protein